MTGGLSQEALDKLAAAFAAESAIKKVVLYGSRAKGNYRPGSDIDLTIRDSGLALSDMLRLETRLDDLSLPWMIDLCQYEDIENPDLRAHIDRVGVVIFQRD